MVRIGSVFELKTEQNRNIYGYRGLNLKLKVKEWKVCNYNSQK